MRRHLLEGNEEILGIKIDTLIYGAGKGIFRSFEDFDLCVEPYMKAAGTRFIYLGIWIMRGLGFMRICQQILVKSGILFRLKPDIRKC